MKKTYIAPAEKMAELDMQDGILNPTSDVSLQSIEMTEDDEQLVKENRKSFNLWNQEW